MKRFLVAVAVLLSVASVAVAGQGGDLVCDPEKACVGK